MLNKKKAEAKPFLQQYTNAKVFGLVDHQGKPCVLSEGLILAVGNQMFALSEHVPFEDCGAAFDAAPLEEVCKEKWVEHFGDVEDAHY